MFWTASTIAPNKAHRRRNMRQLRVTILRNHTKGKYARGEQWNGVSAMGEKFTKRPVGNY